MDIIFRNVEFDSLATLIERLRGSERQLIEAARRPREQLTGIHTIMMAKSAYEDAIAHLQWHGREAGGILIGPMGHHSVTHFVPDLTGVGTPGSFTLDAGQLNATLKQYLPLKLDCKGLIHAHPPGVRSLSSGDMQYVRRLLSNPRNATDRLLMPIVSDGEVIPFVIFQTDPGTAHAGNLVLF